MGIRDHLTVLRCRGRTADVERLIGSMRPAMRAASINVVVSFGEAHLRRVLKTSRLVLNVYEHTSHWIKMRRTSVALYPWGRIAGIPMVGGLHHQICLALSFDSGTPGDGGITGCHHGPALALAECLP